MAEAPDYNSLDGSQFGEDAPVVRALAGMLYSRNHNMQWAELIKRAERESDSDGLGPRTMNRFLVRQYLGEAAKIVGQVRAAEQIARFQLPKKRRRA